MEHYLILWRVSLKENSGLAEWFHKSAVSSGALLTRTQSGEMEKRRGKQVPNSIHGCTFV